MHTTQPHSQKICWTQTEAFLAMFEYYYLCVFDVLLMSHDVTPTIPNNNVGGYIMPQGKSALYNKYNDMKKYNDIEKTKANTMTCT